MFENLKIIGLGSDPDMNNHTTISLDKSVLQDLDRDRPANGYPEAQERAIAEMRNRVKDYEAIYGEVK